MNREMLKDQIGEMRVIGYQPEVITFNPNKTLTYQIIVAKNDVVYISKEDEDDWDSVPKSEMIKVRGLLDSISDVSRFKIRVGKYAGEYIIEDFKVTEVFKQKKII